MMLRCNVYKSGGDCSNGGVSAENSFVLLDILGKQDEPEINGTPVVRLIRRRIAGAEYLHAEPVAPVPARQNGYMHGGCFIHSSDGRFPNAYPIALHDRTEVPQNY